MTYTEFRDKYNGQYVDWDGAYGPQCWDLAQMYFTECLEVPSWVLSGCGLVSNMLWQPKRSDLDAYFDEVDVHNMDQGDVCIWEEGHIAIFDNWDGYDCWYFSQNPNPSQVMQCNLGSTMHAFRLRKEQPTPKPEVTPNVEKDIYKNQIEVKEGITDLRVRALPSLNGDILGYASVGYYDYQEIVDAEGYNWYRIADNQWIAYNEEWENVYPATPKDEYINVPPTIEARNIYLYSDKLQFGALNPSNTDGLSYKILSQDGEYAEIEIGKVWIKTIDGVTITNTPEYQRGDK